MLDFISNTKNLEWVYPVTELHKLQNNDLISKFLKIISRNYYSAYCLVLMNHFLCRGVCTLWNEKPCFEILFEPCLLKMSVEFTFIL